jgi:hypothetical protein
VVGIPYQLTHPLGSSPVGTVWAAVDGQGGALSIAVLDVAAAADPHWRNAFATAAASFGQLRSDLHSDLTDAAPWVACPLDGGPTTDRVFMMMGVEYFPSHSAASGPAPGPDAAPITWPDEPTDAWPETPRSLDDKTFAPISPSFLAGRPEPAVTGPAVTGPIATGPIATGPIGTGPIGTGPVATGPADASVIGAPGPVWDAPSPFAMPSTPGPSVPQPLPQVPPRRRHTALLVGVAALVVVILAGGAGIFVWQAQGNSPKPQASATRAASSPIAAPAPQASPRQPGVEPPKSGAWPGKWQRFKDTDAVRTYAHLDGLDFMVKVPLTWQCVLGDRAAGFTRYNCGAPAGSGQQVGGEIIERTCAAPCDDERMTQMRKSEEAWGLQWSHGGRYSVYAESLALPIDGGTRYALVAVGYFRAGTDGELDRQIVFRMTSPNKDLASVRDVLDFLRDELLF